MSTPAVDSYREVAATLAPQAVSEYLAAHEWELDSRQDAVREIWRVPGEARRRIMLPLATDYADFPQRFNDVLFALGRHYGWDPSELLEQITATRADMFFLRLDQEMIDGTIPFRQAERTIDALFKMLRAAATTAANPLHSHKGRRPATVTDFLEEGVRLGHTKRGSFIFTVVTRLGDGRQVARDDDGVSQANFPRRVMETLARGLETTRDVSRSWDDRVLESPGNLGLSASLVESLEDIAEPDVLRSVDLSFRWASAEPRPKVGLRPITLDRNLIAGLPVVRERLVRQEEPPRKVTLVGAVRSLFREEPDLDGDEAATVQLLAEVHGRIRTVHILLSGQDHDWAIVAYRRKLPFTVTGTLVFERRSWRLTGDIEVDPSFLEHRAENNAQTETAGGDSAEDVG